MVSIPRLKDLCGIQVAILHANELEVKKKILRDPLFNPENMRDVYYFEKFKDVYSWFEVMEKKVASTLQKFPPGLRKIIPAPVIIRCSLRAREWAKFYEKNFNLAFDYGYYFLRSDFFTSKGIINEEKVMREILKNTEISSSIRFCIACYFCFSDVIPALWEQLPEDERPEIDNGVYKHGLGIGGDNEMVVLWSHFLLGDLKNILKDGNSFSFYKFTKSFRNDVSFKNCFEELNERERNKAVIFTRNEFDSIQYLKPIYKEFLLFQPRIELLIVLLRHLDEKQLKVFFQAYHTLYLVLHYLLRWPYQHLFMSTVNRVWELLPISTFCLLLYRIIMLVTNKMSSKFFDYRPILKEFWIQSPSDFKTFFFFLEGRQNHYSVWADEEEDEFYDCFIEELTEECGMSDRFLIFYLNSSSFTFEDEEVIRLIFGSATLEEKSFIVASQGLWIGEMALEIGDLKRIDFFIECFVPQENVTSFKRELMNNTSVTKVLWNLIPSGKLEVFQENLNWALCGEEIKEFQRSLLNSYLRGSVFYCHNLNSLEYIDKFMKWNLTSCERKVLMKKLLTPVNHFAKNYEYILLNGYFQKIDLHLNWISSDIDIVKFRRDVAFETIRYMNYYYIMKGLNYVKNFVRWAKLSREDCKDFKRRFAFSRSVIKYYSECVAERQLYRTDVFIRWAELTETETKDFKEQLVFNDGKVVSECVSLILNGKLSLVEKLITWTQLSLENISLFYSILPMEFDLHFHITERKVKLRDVKKFFIGLPLSEQEIKGCKNYLGLKSANVIEYYVEKNKWDEAEELLSWCFSSEKKVNQFKKNIISENTNIYLNLILEMRLDDVDKFFTWTGIGNCFKIRLLRDTIYDNSIYEMVTTKLMENKNELERLLNWLSANDLLLEKWKECFLQWCGNKVEGICYYSDCRSNLDKNSFCSLCERHSPSSKDISGFIRLFDEHVNKQEGNLKRKLGSYEVNTRQTKRSRHC